MFTELVNQIPLVTKHTTVSQLYGITEILGCKGGDLKVIEKYLSNHNISLNIENHQGPLSKSYTFSNTAIALRKVYTQWPTHLLEIVAHCLQLDPANRKNAAQLLDMEFFTVGNFTSNFDKKLEVILEYDRAFYTNSLSDD